MNILGVSAHFHDSACCLLQDGELTAAASEERFSRVKHDPRLPVEAFAYCLRAGGLTVADVDAVAYYEVALEKLDRQRRTAGRESDPTRPQREIRERLGFEGPILEFPHHLSHAASAFFYSGYPDAAVLTVDGVGEWTTTAYGRAAGAELELFEEVRFPHSLGLFYSTITSYLGFAVNGGESKVMGLASYGEPRLLDRLRKLVPRRAGGGFELDVDYFDFVHGPRMYSSRLGELLGAPPRSPGGRIEAFHRDLARSAQALLEEILLEKATYLRSRVESRRLCLAGGVALNCVANGRLRREGPFDEIWIQPAAGDAGGCLGAAALAHLRLTGDPIARPMAGAGLGPGWTSEEIASLLGETPLRPEDYREREDELVAAVVERLAAGEIVGWFDGRMEFGPRALGNRSILAAPFDADTRDRLNEKIKRREPFRPFAPSVLAERAGEHFDLGAASPYMLEACAVISPLRLDAITHVDGSARPQTVDALHHRRFARLLAAFERRSGCPVLLNTSFNRAGEPIVCSPADAILCMSKSGLDALVLGDFVIDRAMLPDAWPELLAGWTTEPGGLPGRESAVSETLYTLV